MALEYILRIHMYIPLQVTVDDDDDDDDDDDYDL